MSTVDFQPDQADPVQPEQPTTVGGTLLRYLGIAIFTGFSIFFIYLLLSDGYWPLALVIGVITFMIDFVFLNPKAYPLRWMSPGLTFMILISVYPILFTVYISFTNYGTGHLLPKQQTIDVLSTRTFLPEEGNLLSYYAYRRGDGEFGLWLVPEGGEQPGFFVTADGLQLNPDELNLGAIDADGVPGSIEGWTALSRAELVRNIDVLGRLAFGEEESAVSLTGRLGVAAQLQPRYVYDPETDTMTDKQTGTVYFADAETGFFTSAEGQRLLPGYQVTVGLSNYQRFLTDPSFRGPLLLIFIWTFVFALVSVVLSFALGLMIAVVFGRNMPGQRIIKSLLIIPFAVPQVITILVWRGMLNPLLGVVSQGLQDVFNQPAGWPPFFADPIWVKVALIVINVWLAYPYFMLVSSGALQAIPTDMYEAASIDGAGAFHQFRRLTLPLLLVAVGPLLISSFTVNFNSFNVINLFNSGGPPMVGTATPAGHSDILISYVYNLAFGSGSGQQFGYASAITVVIFLMMVVVTLFQFSRMRIWEEVGESV